MTRGLKVVKLFGIKIRVDWSWLLILVLVVWNLSSTFNQVHAKWSLTFSILIGAIAASIFFLSVLMHELAHSLVAKSQGIPVESITLFLFGGVSNIREEPKSPGHEFVMAFIGPLTSLLLGIGLLLLSSIGLDVKSVRDIQLMDFLSSLNAIRTLGIWLGVINISLGIFNLIPGFPLDGGRVLRSILWAITKNLRKATRWASYVGRAIAWAMIISGIAMMFGLTIPFLGQGLLNGVWLILIGWFLNNAANRGYQQMVIREVLEDVPISRITKRNPPTVSGNISVDELVDDYIMQKDNHAFPVVQDGHLIGIVCLDDVRKVPENERSLKTVEEIMTPRNELLTTTLENNAQEALEDISTNNIRQLIVLENGELYGLVSRRDIVRFLQLQSDDFTRKTDMKRGV